MKAQKLIINWEKQDLSQVFSVNWQTGDVTVNCWLWFAEILWDDDYQERILSEWELEENTVCFFNSPSSLVSVIYHTNIYASDWETMIGNISNVLPDNTISFGSVTTWLLKIINGEMVFFPRMSDTPK